MCSICVSVHMCVCISVYLCVCVSVHLELSGGERDGVSVLFLCVGGEAAALA